MTFIDVKKVSSHIHRNNNRKLRQIISEAKPSDLADILDQLPNNQKLKFYLLIPTKNASEVLLEISAYSRKLILKNLRNRSIASMIESTESDDSADILAEVPQEKVRKVFSFLTKSKKEAIAPLIKYEEDQVGSIMQTEVITLPSKLTVSQAIPLMQKGMRKIEGATNAYVVDSQGKIKGVVTLKNLFYAKKSDKITKAMRRDLIYLNPTQKTHDIAQLFKDQDFITLPVIDRNKKVVGRVTIDDVVDVIEEEVEEDMLKIAGVSPDEGIFDPWFSSLKRRLPWLSVNLLTAILAALVIALFSETIETVVILAAMMPIIAGMGGNAGTQTLTLMVRGIALDQINITNYKKLIGKEVYLGFVNGAIIGAVMAIIAFLWTKNLAISLVIIISMIITLMVAGLSGTLTPLFLKKLKVDPAVASSVIVTTFTDVFGFFVFLGIATALLHFIV